MKRFFTEKLKRFRSEEGQSAVELALTMPLLLLVLSGILDFGWIYMNQYKVEDAAHTAARYAAIYVESYQAEDNVSELIAKTRERAVENLLNGEDATVTVEIDTDKVTVTVTQPVRTLTFVASTIFGSTYSASSSCVSVY